MAFTRGKSLGAKTLRACGCICAASALLACSGAVDGTPADGSSNGGGTVPGTTGPGGVLPTDPGDVTPVAPPPVENGDPGSIGMHRMNDGEYNYTLQDLFADPTLDYSHGWLPAEAYGFDNIAEVLHMNDTTYEKYFNAAADVVAKVFARPDQVARFVTCTPDVAGCSQTIVQNMGLEVWRRPLQAAEVTNMVGVYDRAVALGLDHTNAVKEVLQAMLVSPEFLYRIELDPDPTSAVPHAVTDYELASRLSYFLWSAGPDAQLLADAATAALQDPGVLTAEVSRMIDDPRADRFVRSFAGQWLSVRLAPGHVAFPEFFPTWSPELGQSMAEEAYMYFAEFLRTNRPWTEFVSADINFVDGRLAQHYGMPAPADPNTFTRVEVTDDLRRGFLGLASFLTTSSYPRRTSPTKRAARILSDLLCTEPPQPPPAVATQVQQQLAEADAQADQGAADVQDIRAWLEQHRSDPGCAACHSIFDPYGMALENFDGIGAYRTAYPNGNPIDPSATLVDGTVLTGFDDVVNAISADPRLSSCVAEKAFIYGLGRGVTDADRPYIDGIAAAWPASEVPTLRGLILYLTSADTFRMRRAQTAN